MYRRQWQVKGRKGLKPIRKAPHQSPGAKVSSDLLVVIQPGLVSRLDERHTKQQIYEATEFINYFHNTATHTYKLSRMLNKHCKLSTILRYMPAYMESKFSHIV